MTKTSTGRPHAFPSLSHPSANGVYSGGRPGSIPTTVTRYPTGSVRFQEPCSAMKIRFRYRSGNMRPV